MRTLPAARRDDVEGEGRGARWIGCHVRGVHAQGVVLEEHGDRDRGVGSGAPEDAAEGRPRQPQHRPLSE